MANRDTILAGDFTIHYPAENNRAQIRWTGSATGTRTANEVYSALMDLFDEPAQMDDRVPIKFDTPTIYRWINQWFVDDDTMEHVIGGSMISDGWQTGTNDFIKQIGADMAIPFSAHDIGRTLVGATTGDTGTLLDFNNNRGLVWIRPDDPAQTTGDAFDDATEAYSVQNNAAVQVWAVDDTPADNEFVDETADFNSAANADFQPFTFAAAEAIGDYCAFGFSQEFSRLIFDYANGTAGVGGTVAWEYWSGSSWTALSGVSDATNGFTTAAADGLAVTWTAPTDWATRTLNGSAQLFYVRARVTATYSTNPILDQGFIAGQGAGNFQSHARHGGGAVSGESAWVGITTQLIGVLDETPPHIYIFRENPDEPAGTLIEDRVLATKGTEDWWGVGDIDILLKVMEADSIFGEAPAASPTGLATANFFARQYSSLYGNFLSAALATTGGNASIPIAIGDDLDNTTGHRSLLMSSDSGNFSVGDRISHDASTVHGVIAAISGTSPTRTLRYFLAGSTLSDFQDTDTVTNLDDTGTGTVNGAPSDFGPALLSGVTIAFGATTEDILDGLGAAPYSIRVDPNSETLADVYEVLKYRTRRGSTVLLNGHEGQEYVGNVLQIQYASQAGGAFTAGDRVFDQSAEAVGVVVADHDDGATGDLIIRALRGVFAASNVLSDSPDPTQTVGFVGTVSSTGVISDQTANAQSAGTNDTTLTLDTIGDAAYFGASKVFARIVLDYTSGTPGVGGAGVWEYWDGSAWQSLEATVNFNDASTDLTAAAGVRNLDFSPPGDWTPVVLEEAGNASSFGPLYMVRLRATTVYSTSPILDQVTVEDLVTATISSIRTITSRSTSPFGIKAGSIVFFAPGVAITRTNLASGDEQNYRLTDDDGLLHTPPNTVSITFGNLVAGDAVTVFLLTGVGGSIDKSMFTLAAANNQNDTTVDVNETITNERPSSGKIYLVSDSGEEHRYRYASFSGSTFTLDTGVNDGTSDGGNSSNTRLHDTTGTPFANAEVGDYVRNVTEDFIARITNVVNSNEVDTEPLPGAASWSGDTYDYNVLLVNYSQNNNAYVPFMERIADTATENVQVVQSVVRQLRFDARNAGVIVPFSQDTTLEATGRQIDAIRNPDTVFT